MADMPAGQLPVQLTSFIGRERELAEVRRLLAGTRLLTLTGAGGSGKTRLALEAAGGATPELVDRVACVELAPLTDGRRVPELVASQLGISEQPGRSTMDALVAALRTGRLLLVLDNCEHVIEPCAVLADTLLRACPDLRIMATSRAALGIGGETAWLVPLLTVPDPGDPAERAVHAESVQLFVARARDVRPDFGIDAENVAAVVQICRRLDGIPLALELAAARLRSLPPEQVARRLDNRFQLLTTGSRTALPRQQTLRATIDWSYELLAAPERLLFERLAVFAGSFALEAAESVCADAGIPADAVLDLLSSLVEQSLVELVEHGGAARYRLLETVLQYAAERLDARGADAAVRARHARFYHALVIEAEPHLTTPNRRLWIDGIDRDFDNVRRALGWLAVHEPRGALTLAGSLCWYWFATERWSEGRRWLEAALDATSELDVPRDRAAALFAAGVIAGLQTDAAAARPWLEQSIALAMETGDERLAAYARNYLGLVLVHLARPEAVAPLTTALHWFREHGDLYGLRLALLLLGTDHMIHGRAGEAIRAMEEGVDVAREFGLQRELAIALQMLGTAVFDAGDVDRAETLFSESLLALRDDPHLLFVARVVDMIGVVRSERGAHGEAVRHFASAATLRERIGASPFMHDVRRIEPRLERSRTALGGEAAEHAWNEGRRRSPEDALAAALVRVSHGTPAPADPPSAPDRSNGSIGAASTTATTPVESPASSARGSVGSAVPDAKAALPEPAIALQVRALGPLEIVRDGVLLTPEDWTHLRPRELLLYLLCNPAGRTREQVGLVFWPDSSPAQVKNSFHVALHHLRKTLGRPEWVVFDRDRYRINPGLGLDFDAVAFGTGIEAALRDVRLGHEPSARLQAALALYRGEFLEEEQVGDWHLEHRDRLRRLFVLGLKARGEALMREGGWADAADVFRRIVAVEDLDEEAHRLLITCLARSGERGRALRHFEHLVALLQQEIGAEPEPETVALHHRLQRAEPV
jgi:predicted ATPase/DNA-binding SARP family transcriptional activator